LATWGGKALDVKESYRTELMGEESGGGLSRGVGRGASDCHKKGDRKRRRGKTPPTSRPKKRFSNERVERIRNALDTRKSKPGGRREIGPGRQRG